jgi:hypothetical protein
MGAVGSSYFALEVATPKCKNNDSSHAKSNDSKLLALQTPIEQFD